MSEDLRGPDTEDGEEMFADLGRFETGTVPVDAVVKQGRAIRNRRRAIGGSALAVAAALSIGVPVAIAGGSGTTEYGTSSGGARVTVNPVSVSGHKGHFSGIVDGKKWSVDFDNKNCYYIEWACGFQGPYPWDTYASLTFNSSWGLQGQPDNYTLFVKKNVARATIILQDGEVLHLPAVPVTDGPVVLFALPFGLGVSKIELFDEQGTEIAYTLPFNIKGSASVAGQWHKPDEEAPGVTGSVELARGDSGLGPEVITAYVGPAGPCIVTLADGHPNPTCGHLGLVTGSSVVIRTEARVPGSAHSPSSITTFGLVAPNVDKLQLDYTDGTKSPLSIKSLGGFRFYAYTISNGKELNGVTAFDAAGNALPDQNNAK